MQPANHGIATIACCDYLRSTTELSSGPQLFPQHSISLQFQVNSPLSITRKLLKCSFSNAWNPSSKACLQCNNNKLMRQRKDKKGHHNQTSERLSEFHLLGSAEQIQGHGMSWLCIPLLFSCFLMFSFHLGEEYEKKQPKKRWKKLLSWMFAISLWLNPHADNTLNIK